MTKFMSRAAAPRRLARVSRSGNPHNRAGDSARADRRANAVDVRRGSKKERQETGRDGARSERAGLVGNSGATESDRANHGVGERRESACRLMPIPHFHAACRPSCRAGRFVAWGVAAQAGG
ncbi:hypothetical protein C7S17_5051 [Burkholderia thailandensis]|nr:hypothetical protein [Burkholderia thailandensis]